MKRFEALFSSPNLAGALLFFLLWICPGSSAAADILAGMGRSFVARFDQAIGADSPSTTKVIAIGGAIVPDGLNGQALRLKNGNYLKLTDDNLLNSQEGTISLWVRPDWSDADPGSRTFISFPWPDGRNGYFALAKGWWEPKGKPFLYFIANNQDHSHTHKLVRFDRGEWTHLACSWKEGRDGYIRLFVNGFRAGEGKPPAMNPGAGGKEIFIGSDKGTPLAKERWAESDFDELAFFRKALTDDEIYRIYRAQDTRVFVSLKDKNGRLIEFRAIFDEGQGWMTELGAKRTIERIKHAGFNAYIPCVWHGRGTRYLREGLPLEKGIQVAGVDPLKRLIEIAHENGIEVHPWFCVALRQQEFFKDYYGPGTPKDAFDVHRPAFRDFITGLILDVVRRYDVDGINLDFIRTMGTCTCDYCTAEYKTQFNRDLRTDMAQTQPDGTLAPNLQRWHDEAVGAIVREVSQKSKQIKPGLVISVDGHPRPYPNDQGRNEIKWANDGHVDVIFNMIYGKIPDFEQHHFMRRRLANPEKLVILLSNMDFENRKPVSRDPAWIDKTVDYSLRRWPGAVGVYIYSMFNDAQADSLAKGPFRVNATPRPQQKKAEAQR